VGGIVSRILRGSGMTPTVIDFSSKQLEILKSFDVHAYYGDATRPDLLHAAGIAEAKLFVIAIDDKDQITALAKYVHHHYPNLHVVARAVDRNHVYDLWHVGCRDIIRDTYDSSLRMGRSAIEALGYSSDQAQRMTEAFTDIDRQFMVSVAEHYDPAIPILENEAYVTSVREFRGNWQADLTAKMEAIMSEKKHEH
jgi:CPA2 family monovalent cation:H+ antiporter-2